MADRPRDLRRLLPSDDEVEQALRASLQAGTPGPPGGGKEPPAFQDVRPDRLVTGRVLSSGPHGVVVDLSYKSEGVVPLEELPEPLPAVGDELEALVVQMENEDGLVLLSVREAGRRRVMEEVAQGGAPADAVYSGKVTGAVRGGLLVDIGVQAFLPARELDLHYVEDLEAWAGRELDVRVLEADPGGRRVVVSRRAVLEERREARRNELLQTLKPGARVRGTVSNVTDFGAFVDLGGADGLVHRNDLAWGRVEHPSEVVEPGQEVDVEVLEVDRERRRVSLSMRAVQADPWTDLCRRYPFATIARGTVTRLEDFGAFVEVEEGVEGLVHVSEISWTRRVRHPGEVLQVGQEVTCIVLGADEERRRLSLSIRQCTPDPLEEFVEAHPEGSVVEGRVTGFAPFGAFVEVAPGVEGLVHVSRMGHRRVERPQEVLRPEQEVTVSVVSVDMERRRVALAIRDTPGG